MSGSSKLFIEVVILNKSRKVRSFESNENTQRQSLGHIAQFRIMNHENTQRQSVGHIAQFRIIKRLLGLQGSFKF